MPDAALLVYTDACPTDWLGPDKNDRWHTISYVVVPDAVRFMETMTALCSHLPNRRLRRWAGKAAYRERFKSALPTLWPEFLLWINAISFRESTLRSRKDAVLAMFNEYTAEGRSIGFATVQDRNGKPMLRHESVSMSGYHIVEAPEDKVLVLLVLAWMAASQYWFYRQRPPFAGHERVSLIIVSDLLSGDTQARQMGLVAIRGLIDHDSMFPTLVAFSRKELPNAGELLVDNVAGWLDECLRDPAELARLRSTLPDLLGGWKKLVATPDGVSRVSANSEAWD